MPPKADLAAEEAEEEWPPKAPEQPDLEVAKKAAKPQSAAGSAVPRAVGLEPKEAKDALHAVVDLTAEEAEEQWLPNAPGHPDVPAAKKAPGDLEVHPRGPGGTFCSLDILMLRLTRRLRRRPRCPRVPPKADLAAQDADVACLPHVPCHPDVEVEMKAATEG